MTFIPPHRIPISAPTDRKKEHHHHDQNHSSSVGIYSENDFEGSHGSQGHTKNPSIVCHIKCMTKTTPQKGNAPKPPNPAQPASQPSPQNCHPANPKPNTTSSSEKPEPIIIKSKIKINIRIKQIHRRRPRLIALKMIQNLQKPHPQKVPSAGKYLPEKKNRSGR